MNNFRFHYPQTTHEQRAGAIFCCETAKNVSARFYGKLFKKVIISLRLFYKVKYLKYATISPIKILIHLCLYFGTSLATNVVAALRRRGFHKRSCGVQTSKFPQHFLRSYCPAFAKPLVRCSCVSIYPLFFINHDFPISIISQK